MYDVLVIEDDELLRALVSEWLTQAGYAVAQAGDGEAAVAALSRHPAAMVITDMNMPRLDGAQMLEWLRRERPAMPVVAMSGHFGTGRRYTRDRALTLGARRVLDKPFTQDELLEAVGQLIGARPRPEPNMSQ